MAATSQKLPIKILSSVTIVFQCSSSNGSTGTTDRVGVPRGVAGFRRFDFGAPIRLKSCRTPPPPPVALTANPEPLCQALCARKAVSLRLILHCSVVSECGVVSVSAAAATTSLTRMTGIPIIVGFGCGLQLRRWVAVQGERKSLQVPPDFSIRSVDSTASPGSCRCGLEWTLRGSSW